MLGMGPDQTISGGNLVFFSHGSPCSVFCEALRRVFDAHLARQDMRKARLVAAEALRHFREQNNKPAQDRTQLAHLP